MTERVPRAIDDEGPALLGSPTSPALTAYYYHLDHPFIDDAENEILGGRIYAGNLAAQRLADPDAEIGFEHFIRLEDQVEVGMAARRVVASRHLALVVALANKFSFSGEQKEHMIGVGNVALMNCMRGYRHREGRHMTPFLQVAVTRGLILDVIADHRRQTGRSQKMQLALREINRAYEAAQELGEDVTYLEVAERLGFRPERVEWILRLKRIQTVGLDAPVIRHDRSRALGDTVGDKDAARELEAVEDNLLLKQAWDTATELHRRQILTDREWKVFVLRYRDGLTQQAIAEEWEHSLTQSSVYVIEHQALRKVKREIENPGCHEQALDPAFTLVETATDLLRILGVPIDARTDIKATARFIIDNAELTQLQQVTMHALLGTYNRHFRPHEFAKLRGVTYRAVYDTREKAMRRLYATFGSLPEVEDLTPLEVIVARTGTDRTVEEETYDFEATVASMQLWKKGSVARSGADGPSTMRRARFDSMDEGALLGLALELKPRGVLSRADLSRLAVEGSFVGLDAVTERFGSLATFQQLCRELRTLRRG